jgi:hypothetical protein
MEVEEVFIEELMKKFVGKWIAVKDEQVVAVSETHDEIMREIKQKGLDGIYVFYSPTEKEKKYEFLFR